MEIGTKSFLGAFPELAYRVREKTRDVVLCCFLPPDNVLHIGFRQILATLGGTEFIFNFHNARKFLFDRIIIETCKVKNWKVTYVFQNIFSLILIFFALSITYPYIWMRSAVLFKLTEDIVKLTTVWKVWGILTNRSKTKNFFATICEKRKK